MPAIEAGGVLPRSSRRPVGPISIGTLVARQNPDGGWPHVRGRSWTEPTVYAAIALLAAGQNDAARRALRWLAATQRADGGWAPQVPVEQSSTVTAAVALLPPPALGEALHNRAISWLLDVNGEEFSLTQRVRRFLGGRRREPAEQFPGWPWSPGSASWVAPTALAVLALARRNAHRDSARVRERLELGRCFLLSRACATGGWNYGGVPDIGPDSHAYPETTGMALAALRGVRAPQVQRGIEMAKALLPGCRSAGALAWLRLGLLAHGELPRGDSYPDGVLCGSIADLALGLAVSAAEHGRDVFWT